MGGGAPDARRTRLVRFHLANMNHESVLPYGVIWVAGSWDDWKAPVSDHWHPFMPLAAHTLQ
jgi:hypothetical protein